MKTDAQLFSEFIPRHSFYLREKNNISQREFYGSTNINCSRFENVNLTCTSITLYEASVYHRMSVINFLARSDEYIAYIKKGKNGADFF